MVHPENTNITRSEFKNITVSTSLMKQETRLKARNRRSKLSETERKEKSARILESVKSLKFFKKADVVSCYVNTKTEAETRDLIEWIWSVGRTVVVPFSDGNEMKMSKIKSLSELEPKSLFHEPIEKNEFQGKIDVFIVPGIAFDESGARIGYGKGFYDRFLENHSDCVLVGLAFDCQLVEGILKEEHDVSMDFVVTEKRIVNCKN